MLVFTELLLIADYTFRIPTRLGCPLVEPWEPLGEVLGIHTAARACLPQFAVYLVTLMHTNAIARQHVR